MPLTAGHRLKMSSLALSIMLGTIGPTNGQQAPTSKVAISASDIGGTVVSEHGPEAGVWVIAETRDLPTRFAKIVVTDDQGRFVIPDLPAATYRVWTRGYGLVDAPKVDARTGGLLDLRAVPAPSAREAAQYYPGMYWYALLGVPPQSEFPGTGDLGNHIPPTMKSQAAWVDTIKNMCQSCHALGSRGIREIPAFFRAGNDSQTAWAIRTQAGQAQAYMAVALGSLGVDKAYTVFADWTDRIAAGELPFAKPERPQGVERNVVITSWDWADPKHYQHDAISTDKRDPTVNANGLIWGSPEESTDLVPTLDPVRNIAGEVRHPYLDPKIPSSLDALRGPSAYWGEEPIWDGHTSIHNVMMDEKGKVWFTARLRPRENPAFCSTHPSAAAAPLQVSDRQLSMYDPATGRWDLIDTCFTTHHLYFGHDPDNTLWTSAGGPASGVVGWLNTRVYRETHDAAKAQGWTPIIVDTNGNGRRDDFVEADQPLDPSKDKRVMAAFYGVMPSPVDNTVWGQSMDRGFSRIDQPGYIIRLDLGPDPARTALAEIYQPPEGSFGPRGLDIGLDGVAWTALSSGHLASFDRSKCRGPLGGPQAAEGRLCPEGWRLYRFPGPQIRGLDTSGSAEHAYYVWVDRYNILGLGANVPIASANGGERLLALVNDSFVSLRVPYPLGFFTKNVDGRIDDPAAGWKGRGLWTTSGTRANFHGEGGTEASPNVFKFQLRPDPLAH
ncbi:carboxypeptidase-like regulatory domain-containing protein [Methylobacterium nodulans]|uniref:Carboxypeptidase regulatory-like domain-containing protein n=1 Tax=Methylobacterium nodulans (strain LMG 21967 / CNCM I-2342 / ORS 2060) TaxID=460265 RepID=B8IA34_METNO|nr:carboxypeptidase-like regulatory domain-containing protein [Methylobacterium nodulans]ACL57262.1 conserved hypothetical protein [Methylobacterium nodulans ORS 2060]